VAFGWLERYFKAPRLSMSLYPPYYPGAHAETGQIPMTSWSLYAHACIVAVQMELGLGPRSSRELQ
jgi:hypothetical protein